MTSDLLCNGTSTNGENTKLPLNHFLALVTKSFTESATFYLDSVSEDSFSSDLQLGRWPNILPAACPVSQTIFHIPRHPSLFYLVSSGTGDLKRDRFSLRVAGRNLGNDADWSCRKQSFGSLISTRLCYSSCMGIIRA